MALDKKISFRLPNEQYYTLYRIYENYKLSAINLTFSDFLRNLILSLAIKLDDENKTNTQ